VRESFSYCLLVVALLAVCASCRTQRSEQANAVDQVSQATPQRIVSISPSVTEILYGVGAWPQVVAVSQFCSYPEDVNNKPRVNGWEKTNLEQLTALRPDLVIGVEAQAPFLQDKLSELGIHSLFLRSQTLKDVYVAIETIGARTGHQQQAMELAAKTAAEIDAVRKAVADRQRLKVLCVVDRVPGTIRELYTATRGSYLDEIITIAGGESIAPAAEHGWGKITKEAAVSLNPEVIIDMVQSSKGNFGEDALAVWQELSDVRAVQHKRIYPIRDDMAIHPSQFVGHTARVFARVIHPEAFADGP
jgi:iron complex transport system substrate-binding protein